MKKINNKIITYIGVVLFFIALSYSFVPEVLTGKIVNQGDISGFVGMSKEAKDWNEAHPENKTAWTDAMFGGMPTTMITGHKEGDYTDPLYKAIQIGKRPADYLFVSLLGAFLLMLSLGINGIIAIGGAIAVTFCSYNMQIIQVGHNSKMMAIAFLPWVLASIIFTYKKALGQNGKSSYGNSIKSWLPMTILGASLFAMALNFQIKANHIQITYYLAIIIFFYIVVLLTWIIIHKENRKLFGKFVVASALLLVMGLFGIGANANKLLTSYEYSKHTMRGGSELKTESGEKTSGLDLDYATAWSYGFQELPNLFIPDYNGGASAGAINPDKSATIQLLKSAGQGNLNAISKSLPLYWGPQPFTAGPMYIGAITVFLFILGLGLYKGKEKWWLLFPTIISILLALGNHFMPFSEFWFKYMPLYNKFRTVSMALVILQFTLPVLGFLVLDKIIKSEYDRKSFLKWGVISLLITGGFCLLSITGWGRTFTGPSDAGQQAILIDALIEDRKMLLRNDALMSLLLIVVTFFVIMWSYSEKRQDKALSKRITAGVIICLLVIINMFAVGKRYLNSDHFISVRAFDNQFVMRPVDKLILQDTTKSYRVLDLSVNVFNDSHPSYFHKNIGGYSPAKLQRYQDLIEQYLTPEINNIYKSFKGKTTLKEVEQSLPSMPILSMLNCKYIIVGADSEPLINNKAAGNCHFVDSVVFSKSPKEEIKLLGEVNLNNVAVIDISKKENLNIKDKIYDVSDYIEQVSYAPNELKYNYNIAEDRLAVFSEIYYPDGWIAKLEDGTPVNIMCADWTLRAVKLPKGKHTLTMHFAPKSYKVGADISKVSSCMIFVFLLFGILSAANEIYRKRKSI